MSAEADKDKVQGAPMFASAEKIYPREMKGRFDRLSKLATLPCSDCSMSCRG